MPTVRLVIVHNEGASPRIDPGAYVIVHAAILDDRAWTDRNPVSASCDTLSAVLTGGLPACTP